MSNKDKDSKSLPDKVKEFFRRNKTSAGKLNIHSSTELYNETFQGAPLVKMSTT